MVLAACNFCCTRGLDNTNAKKLNQINDKRNNNIAAAIFVELFTCGVINTENNVIKNISAFGLSKLVYKPTLKPFIDDINPVFIGWL